MNRTLQLRRPINETFPSSCDINSAAGCAAMEDGPPKNVNAAAAARAQTQQILLHLAAHLISQHGEIGAVHRAYMIFDACGPGRNIDPQILFKEDSEGDAWAEAISHLIF